MGGERCFTARAGVTPKMPVVSDNKMMADIMRLVKECFTVLLLGLTSGFWQQLSKGVTIATPRQMQNGYWDMICFFPHAKKIIRFFYWQNRVQQKHNKTLIAP
jgi:hypothetical protein